MDLEDVKICVIGAIATAGTLSVSKHVGGRILSDEEIADLLFAAVHKLRHIK